MSRLLESVPPVLGGDLKQSLEQARPSIETAREQVAEVIRPNSRHDWARMAEVKLAIAQVYLAEIPVLVIGDKVLTRV